MMPTFHPIVISYSSVVARLRPMVPAVERVCGIILNAIIESVSPSGLRDIERVGFMAKVDVVTLLGKLPPDVRLSFAVANKIRNDFAHHLDATITDERAAEFLASFHPTQWDGFMFRAYQAALAPSSRNPRICHCQRSSKRPSHACFISWRPQRVA
jgi:hypothetical protein